MYHLVIGMQVSKKILFLRIFLTWYESQNSVICDNFALRSAWTAQSSLNADVMAPGDYCYEDLPGQIEGFASDDFFYVFIVCVIIDLADPEVFMTLISILFVTSIIRPCGCYGVAIVANSSSRPIYSISLA